MSRPVRPEFPPICYAKAFIVSDRILDDLGYVSIRLLPNTR